MVRVVLVTMCSFFIVQISECLAQPLAWERTMNKGSFHSCVAISPDGSRLATGGGYFPAPGELIVWNPATGEKISTNKNHRMEIRCLAYSPDGKLLATGGGAGDVRLWDARTGEQVAELVGHQHYVARLAFSPDSKLLATAASTSSKSLGGGDERTVRIWDVGKRKAILELTPVAYGIYAMAFSQDGRILAISGGGNDRDIVLVDPITGQEKGRLKGDNEANTLSLAFSPDGTTLASGQGGDGLGTIRLWDWKNGKVKATLKGHRHSVVQLAYFRDGKRLASSSLDRTARLWDLVTEKELASVSCQGQYEDMRGLALSPDEKLLATCCNRVLRVWHVDQLLGQKGKK